MKQYIPEEFSTRLIDWNPLLIMGNTMPPRDPEEDEEDRRTRRRGRGGQEDDNANEPPVVREPDED